MTKRIRKITIVTLLIGMLSSFAAGCSNDATVNENTSTTKEAVTTAVPETTTEEVTTEEPTTTKEVSPEEYDYKGKMFIAYMCVKDYFDGLVVNPGDVIYLNDIWSGETEYDDIVRGETAMCLHINFGDDDALDKFNDLYMSAAGPYVPYSDNYSIEYKGKKIQFVYIGWDGDTFANFDIIPIE